MLSTDGVISTKTYQKKENLFLYIVPHSAHPPGLMKSLIFGLLKTYYLQNTLRKDFLHMVSLLYSRLLARGHKSDSLKQLFLEAIQAIKDYSNPLVLTDLESKDDNLTNPDNRIFFHIPYHPRDISRQKIRDIYEATCENNTTNFQNAVNVQSRELMQIKQLTVAYHRPKNLRDVICPSALVESDTCYVTKYL